MWSRAFRYVAGLIFVIIAAAGCDIREDNSGCPDELWVSVRAIGFGTPKFDEGVSYIYVFDHNKKFLERITLDERAILDHTAIRLYYPNEDNLWLAVWGNLSDKVAVAEPQAGMSMSDCFVYLTRDAQSMGKSPGDLFWGMRNIDNRFRTRAAAQGVRTSPFEVVIQRMTAQLNFMIKGLDPVYASDYRIEVSGWNKDGFDFEGKLAGSSVAFSQEGIFDSGGTIWSPAEMMTALPVAAGGSLTVKIYQGATLLNTATVDIDGNSIVPVQGDVINVMIQIKADIEVTIVVTPWGVREQWMEW